MIGAILLLVPVIGIIALFLLTTVVGVAASISYGPDLVRFANYRRNVLEKMVHPYR